MAAISQTSTTIRRPRYSDVGLLVFCASLWGSAFMMMKVAVVEVPPLSVATGRVLVAAIALVVFSLLRGRRFPRDRHTWVLLFIIGLFGSGVPFFLITWSEQVIDSGMAAILMSSGPMFSLLLAHFFTTDDKFNWYKLLGMGMGFCGVIVVIGTDVLRGVGDNLLPQLATMLAAICYVVSTVLIRKIHNLKPDMLVACSLLAASFVMVPLSLFIDQPWILWQADQAPSAKAIGAIIFLGVVPTAFAFFIRARLVMDVGYTFFSMAGYLVPVFGVIFGALFLNESIETQAVIALFLVLGGVAMTQIRPKRQS